MRFAFCVEDDTDEEVFRTLLSRMLAHPIDVDGYRFPRGGCGVALAVAYKVARRAYHAGLDGALFAVDNDGAPRHRASEVSCDCRLCELRRAAAVDEPRGWSRPGLSPLQYFFAVPVQTLETWLLHARGWDFAGAAETLRATAAGWRQLKTALYGAADPDRSRMREVVRPLLQALEPETLAARSPSFMDFRADVAAAGRAAARAEAECSTTST